MASVCAHSDDDRIDQSPESASDSVQSQLTIHSAPYSGLPTHMYPFSSGFVPTSQPQMRSKRRQVKNACTNCQKACKKCDDARPCLRCVKYGIGEECVDSQRKERKKGIKRGPYKKRDGKSEPFLCIPLLINTCILTLPFQLVAQLLLARLNLTLRHRQPWACHSRECHLAEARPQLPLSWVRWVTRSRSMVPSPRCTSLEKLLLTIPRTMYRCRRPRRLIRGRSMRVNPTLFPLITNITRRTFPTAVCRTPLPISSRIIALICQLLCSHTLSTLGIPTAIMPPTPSLRLPVTQASTSPSA